MEGGGVNDYEQTFVATRNAERYLGSPTGAQAALSLYFVSLPIRHLPLQVIRKQMLWQKHAL